MGENILNKSHIALTDDLEHRLKLLEDRLEHQQKNKNRRQRERQRNIKNLRSKSLGQQIREAPNFYRLIPDSGGNNSDETKSNRVRYPLYPNDYSFQRPFRVIDNEPQSNQDWLLTQLQTNRYFWNTSFQQIAPKYQYTNTNNLLSMNQPMTSINGVLLDSDIPAMEKGLDEIRKTLDQIKNFNMDVSSFDYHRYAKKPDQHDANLSKFDYTSLGNNGTFAEIRARILNMEFYIEKRVRAILDNNQKNTRLQKPLSQQRVGNYRPDSENEAFSKEKDYRLHDGATDIQANVNFNENSSIKDGNVRAQNESLEKIRNIAISMDGSKKENEEKSVKLTNNEDTGRKTYTDKNKPNEKEQRVKSSTVISTENKEIGTNQNISLGLDFGMAPMRSTYQQDNRQDNSQYARMLEMLRRPQYDVSSSSTSSDDELNSKNKQQNPETDGSKVSQQMAPTATNKIVNLKTPIPVKSNPMGSANDSDSDFFN